MDFKDAWNIVIAELTPQPWDYTTEDGTTLTVIPAGMRADLGDAEVYVRITISKAEAAEAAIKSRELPFMIAKLTNDRMWVHETLDDVHCGLTPIRGGGMLLTLAADTADVAQIHIPEAQRLPLASALRRAWDVARGWEG